MGASPTTCPTLKTSRYAPLRQLPPLLAGGRWQLPGRATGTNQCWLRTSLHAPGLLATEPPRSTSLTIVSGPHFHPHQAVAATRAAVLDSNADLGIMLDTDVDRSGVVDRNGNGGCRLGTWEFCVLGGVMCGGRCLGITAACQDGMREAGTSSHHIVSQPC